MRATRSVAPRTTLFLSGGLRNFCLYLVSSWGLYAVLLEREVLGSASD